MRNKARDELSLIIDTITSQLKDATNADDQSLISELHRSCGVLKVGSLQFQSGQIGTLMGDCFDAAFLAGVSLASFSSLRTTIEEFSFSTFQGVVTKQAATVFCLVEEARCVAAMELTTRADAQLIMRSIGAAFDRAEEVSSDIGDTSSYSALVSLHAAFTRDLVRRSSSLPEIVRYSLPISTTSLCLANRLYGDANRSDEIENINGVSHPAFMPAIGIALTR